MALTIATVSLCLCIVLVQHLYNWIIRKAFQIMEEDGMDASPHGLLLAGSIVTLIVTIALFKLLIDINK